VVEIPVLITALPNKGETKISKVSYMGQDVSDMLSVADRDLAHAFAMENGMDGKSITFSQKILVPAADHIAFLEKFGAAPVANTDTGQ
jgi:hypothetical protein